MPTIEGRGASAWQRGMRILGALGLAAAFLFLVLGLYAAMPGAGERALGRAEASLALPGSATGPESPLHWAQAITATSTQVPTSTEMVVSAANGPLALRQSVATGMDDPGVAYNGERITYTLTIANDSGATVTLTGPISLTNEIPQSAGQVQLDHIWCSDECVFGIAMQLVTSPLGESIVVTTVESVAWEVAAAKGQTLTLAAGETITRSFAGRISGQPDGTIIGNNAVIFYEADGTIGFASTPEDAQITVRVRPSLEGTTSLSDAPTWLSRDAGGTLSIDWGDFDRDGDLDLALGSTSGTTVYRNNGGRLILFWEVPIYTLGVRWADLDGDIRNLELVAVGQSDGNSAVTPGTNHVYHLNAGATAFELRSSFSSEMQLLRVVAADWTNDGKVDLVASTNAIDAQCPVRLFANQGDGSFVGPGTCVSDEPTANIAAGDWDNDDDPDLVVGAFPNRTWLLSNNGTANPLTSAPIEVDASATFLPYDFAWGDYDRDGYLDLAAAFPIDRKVRIYHNEAGTGFSHSAELEFRTSLFYTPLAVEWGDLDGNGFLDLIVADSPPIVYLNGGWANPGFSPTRSIPLSPLAEGGQIWSVRAADQDNDGDLDLAFANRDGASLLMTSFSGFLDATLLPVGPARAASSVAWADMDDNGYLDLLFGAGPTVLRTGLYYNNQGVFAATPLQTYDLGPGAAVAVGTMDGNPALDLAIGSLAGLQLYRDGNVSAAPWVPDASTGVDALAWGDAEHDGDLDLLVAQEGALVLYLNEGGQLSGTPMQIAGGDDDLRSVAWGDYDGDHYPDIAVGSYGRANRIYHNEGGNVFGLVAGPSAPANTTAVAWADYDQDGDFDLAVGNYGQRNEIYQNRNGVLSATPLWSSPDTAKTTGIAWGDWDNDGDLDLAVGNDGECDQVYVNQGSTPQSAQFVWVWSSAEKLATTGVAWGDADRDGDLDLAISQGGSGRNGIYVNNHVVPSHLADVFVPTMALPDNPSYLSIDRPGTVPDAYLPSSAELLSGDQVAIHYRVHDPDGTRSGIGSNEQGDPVHSMRYEYSLDGGGTWHLATEYVDPMSPPTTYPLPSSRLGTSYTYYWDPEADGAVSDNARFRVTIVPLKEVGPVRRGGAMAVSPPFRVRATTCVWPVDPTISVVPAHPEPGDMVRLAGSVSGGSGIVTYTWDLSDGQTAVGQVVEHRFAKNGTYQVTMTVRSEPCPIVGVVTARQSVAVGSDVLSVYLPLVLRSSQGSASASGLPDAAVAPAGRPYWDALREAGQVGTVETAGQGASLLTYYLAPVPQSVGAALPVLQATPLPATYPQGIVTVSSCITSCVVLPVTKDARGIHTQPSIDNRGDRVAFWSTGNLGGIRSGFDYDLPVVLLVDDDDNGPDVRPYYEAALDALGVSYDVWDTGISDSHEPTLDYLARYRTIIWFSGDEYWHWTAGPGPASEAALASYLNGGDERCLFISSQDYHYNRQLTSFMQSYLGVSSVQDDVAVTAVAGAGVFAGLGAYSLSYPMSNYSDWINPLPPPAAYVGFTGQTDYGSAGTTAVYRDGGAYRTTFWGYPFEAIAGAEQRAAAMDAVLNFCDTRRYVPSLVINEVDLANSIVELYNYSGVPVDTADVAIEASSDGATMGKFVALGTVPAYGYATVSLAVDWSTTSSGSVSLYQSGEHGVDFVRWGASTAEPRTGTYWLGSNPPKPGDLDNTLGRGDDTNAGSDWCEGEPTLGRKNPGCGEGFNNADGNIEAYWAEIGIVGDITYTQVTSTSGSILGGFNLWPSLDGQGQHIAFFSDRNLTGGNGDANFEIWRYDLVAGTFLQVTDSRECVNLYPSSSADGARVVFASDCDLAGSNADENQEIYLAEIGTTGAVSLTQLSTTQDMLNDQPAISADGTRVAFVQDANAAGDIVVYDISGATPSLIRTYDGGVATQPSLSEDGTYIAFALRAEGDNQEIYRAEVDASPGVNATQVTSTTLGTTNDQPSLSGDGLRLAYVCDSGPDAGVWLYDVADRIRTRVATAGDSNSRPAVSGNGSFVAFSSDRQIYRAEFPLVDLAIAKRSTPAVFTPGRAVTYTITITNYGPSAAIGAIVSDTLPGEIPSVTWACAGYEGASCSLPHGSVLYNPVTLPADSRVVYTVTGVLSPSVIADVVNVAEVIPPPQVSEHVRDNNVTPPDRKTPVPEADVSVVKTASLDEVVAGGTLTYTLSYANLKPSDARPVCITDTLPAGVTFGGEVVPPDYFVLQAQGATVRWCTARLPAQATGDIVYTVTVQSSATGMLTNTVTITSSVFDPTPENNHASLTTTVTTEADLALFKTAAPASLNAGETLTYTVVYTNYGPSDAMGVAITDSLPISVTWNGHATATPAVTGPVAHGQELVWTAPQVAAGTAGRIEYAVVVSDAFGAPGQIANSVVISSTTTDPRAINNSDLSTTTVTVQADLTVSKVGRPVDFVPGKEISYTIAVANEGSVHVPGATVYDPLPNVFKKDSLSWTCVASAGSSCGSPTSGTGDVDATVDLEAGGSITYVVVGTLKPSIKKSLDSIANTAWVTAPVGYNDPDVGNNHATVTNLLQPLVDLQVTKSDSGPAVAGSVLTYTVTFTNAGGPSDASNVLVADRLPAGVTYGGRVSASMPVTETRPSGGAVTWALHTLAPDASGTIVFTVTVDADLLPGTIANQVEISSDEDEGDGTDNQYSLDTEVTAEADLSVTLSASAPVVAGEHLTYTIAYANAGLSYAQYVVVTDVLPADTTLVDANPDATGTGPTLNWTFATLAPGASGQIQVVVAIGSDVTADLSNAVTVTASTADPDTSDNARVLVTPVSTEADLWLQKADAPDPATAGGALTYTLGYGNDGPSTAQGVVVTDTLPAGTMLVGASPGAAQNGQTLTWTLGALAMGASDEITIVVTVDSAATGTVANQADIGSTTSDGDPGDNSAQAETTIESHVNLAVSQTGLGTVHAGEVLTYTLTYTNVASPSTAHNVVVTDLLASGVTFEGMVSGIPPSQSGPPLAWDPGSLGPGASGALVFTATVGTAVADGTVLTNQAGISSSGVELDNADNHSLLDTTVTTEADLSISVSASTPVVAGEDLTYTLTYTNAGPSDAQNVVITDVLPLSTTVVSADPLATPSGQTLNWAFATLARGAPGQIVIVVTVGPAATGTITNQADIGSGTSDGDLGNNSAQIGTAIESRVNLALTQAAPAAVNPGGVLTYTLTYTNVTGPSTAHGVVLTDLLASDVTFGGMVSGASPSQSGQLLTWALGLLDPGSSGTLAFTATADSAVANGTVLLTQAGITGGGTELDDSDNLAEALTTVTTATLVMRADRTRMALAPMGERADARRSPLRLVYLALGMAGAVGYRAAWTGRREGGAGL